MKAIFSTTGRTLTVITLAVFLAIQLIRPKLPNAPATPKHIAPARVQAILQRACYDCHSNQTQLKWFDKTAPASWLVASHVKQARQALNFSEWDTLSAADQNAKLYFSVNDILAGEMPLSSYTMLHPEANLTGKDIEVLKQYLVSISGRPQQVPSDHDTTPTQRSIQPVRIVVKPSPNGIAYIPDYRNWKAISTTDRFDNGTLRIIYGNSIAVKAIQENQVNPWPDGTMFAKVAWAGHTDTLGLIRAGDFRQVEFMIKDSKQYADTKGWGWARWKGKALLPYGQTKLFTTECISCHRPMKDNDFVFTLPLHLNKK